MWRKRDYCGVARGGVHATEEGGVRELNPLPYDELLIREDMPLSSNLVLLIQVITRTRNSNSTSDTVNVWFTRQISTSMQPEDR